MSTIENGQDVFAGSKGVSSDRLNKTVLWRGTALPVGAANKVPYKGAFLLVDSLSAPTTADWYIQTSTTLSSPSFVKLPSSGGLPYLTLSTTIDDYTSPNAAVSSSSDTAPALLIVDNAGTTNIATLRATGDTRVAQSITDAALRNTDISSVKVWLKKNNSPTGTVSLVIRKISDDNIVGTFDNTFDPSEITTGYTQFEFTSAAGITTPNESYRISIEFDGGDASNWIQVEGSSSSVYADGALWTYDPTTWTEGSTDVRMEFVYLASDSTASVYDDNTDTYWKSDSEASPAIYVDLSGSAREIVGIALNINKTETTITAIKIRASTDTSFSDAENIAYVNISDFTENTWRFLANNFLADDRRYVQFIGVGTGILAIYGIKVRYGISDLIKILTHQHRTRTVDSADSFVDAS